MLRRQRVTLALTILILLGGSFGCTSSSIPNGHDPALAPMAAMPITVQQAPARVEQAYRFAAANPDVMKHIPCYCGCNKTGHKSNYDCYISGQDAAGKLTFDSHALGCLICVDITQDAMQLLREGKSTAEIRDYVDVNYARYGPSNRALAE